MLKNICPTITVETPEEFSRQLQQVLAFAARLHFDASDGTLAPRKLLEPEEFSWPDSLQADIHLMSLEPLPVVKRLIPSRPDLVIIHAEASDVDSCLELLKSENIKSGLALLPATSVDTALAYMERIDHLLIFSGNLGYQGGSSADLSLLDKFKPIREKYPQLEIGWDGGVNETNISLLVAGGINVINSGGFIQASANPEEAYAKLLSASGESNVNS
jgi:ribulose-phosphate 3-epimerase